MTKKVKTEVYLPEDIYFKLLELGSILKVKDIGEAIEIAVINEQSIFTLLETLKTMRKERLRRIK